MLKRTITFKNLDDQPVTKDFYFNLTVPEITEMENSMGLEMTMTQHWTNIIANKDAGGLIQAFKDIITRSYGVRDADGITFNKSEEISRKFMQSDAYTVLFMELFGINADDEAFGAFLNGIMPAEVAQKMAETTPQVGTPSDTERTKPEQFTKDELLSMPKERFDQIAGTDPQKMPHEVLLIAMQRRSQGKD